MGSIALHEVEICAPSHSLWIWGQRTCFHPPFLQTLPGRVDQGRIISFSLVVGWWPVYHTRPGKDPSLVRGGRCWERIQVLAALKNHKHSSPGTILGLLAHMASFPCLGKKSFIPEFGRKQSSKKILNFIKICVERRQGKQGGGGEGQQNLLFHQEWPWPKAGVTPAVFLEGPRSLTPWMAPEVTRWPVLKVLFL